MVKLPKQLKLVGIIWLICDTLKEFFKILVLEAAKGNPILKKKNQVCASLLLRWIV